jgi:hypothetical protein
MRSYIRKHKFGQAPFVLEALAKSLKVCEFGNSGLFPSHEINLWICS